MTNRSSRAVHNPIKMFHNCVQHSVRTQPVQESHFTSTCTKSATYSCTMGPFHTVLIARYPALHASAFGIPWNRKLTCHVFDRAHSSSALARLPYSSVPHWVHTIAHACAQTRVKTFCFQFSYACSFIPIQSNAGGGVFSGYTSH